MADDILATLRRAGERATARFEHVYSTDPGDLWSALTDPIRLARWFAHVGGDLEEGGRYHVAFDDDDPSQRSDGTILECESPNHLLVSWVFGDEGETFVRLDLEPTGAGTKLVLEHSRLPIDAAAGYGAGWQTYLEQLRAYLSGENGRGPAWDERWAALLPDYHAMLSQSS